MHCYSRKGFTLLEVVVAVTILSVVVTAGMTVMPKAISSIKQSEKMPKHIEHARNVNEFLLSKTLNEIRNACQSKNPCRSDNSNINSIFPSFLTSNYNVFVSVIFYDNDNNITSDLSKASFARLTVMVTPPDGSEPFVFQNGLAAEYGTNSPYSGSVSGVVRSSGTLPQGVANAEVTLTSTTNPSQFYQTYTNSLGVFNITGVMPGTYNLKVKKTYFVEKTQSNILVDGDENVGTIYIDEKPFKQILDNHFTSSSGLSGSNYTISNSYIQLAENAQATYENPRFSQYTSQSNVTRTSTHVELTKTLKSVNDKLSENKNIYTYWLGTNGACGSLGETNWKNGSGYSFNNQIYTKARFEVTIGYHNYWGCGFAGWGEFEAYLRLLHNGTEVWNKKYYSTGNQGYYWRDTMKTERNLTIGATETFQVQGKTKLTDRGQNDIGAVSKDMYVYGIQRYEYSSTGYVYLDYDLGREVNRILVDWDATVPSGTSLTFKVILYKESTTEYTLSKNSWYNLPKPSRYIRIKAELKSDSNNSKTPELRSYVLKVPAYSSSGQVITQSYASPDGSGTDEIILELYGAETHSQSGSQQKLANICEVQNGVEVNCQTFSSNYVSSGLWPGVALELKKTGTATISAVENVHYNNETQNVSHAGSTSTVSRTFYVDHAQTLYLDYNLVAHSSVLSTDCAKVEVYNPSGSLKFQDTACGASGSAVTVVKNGTNKAISASANEIGTWRILVEVSGKDMVGNVGGTLSSASGTIKFKSILDKTYTLNTSNSSIVTLKQVGTVQPFSKTIKIKQLYQPATPAAYFEYHVSPDNGSTWVQVVPGTQTKIPKAGLNWKVRISIYGGATITPKLDRIRLLGRSP